MLKFSLSSAMLIAHHQEVEAFAEEQCRKNNMPIPQQHQIGRGTAQDATWTDKTVAPVKANRRGDIQSEYAGANLTHSRWTKQVRRLQHFVRCARSEAAGPSMVEHRASLWRKNRQATGFPKGFAKLVGHANQVVFQFACHVAICTSRCRCCQQHFPGVFQPLPNA